MLGRSDSEGIWRGRERHVKGQCSSAHCPFPPFCTGGNAGIAAAYAARKLGIPATVVLPESTSLQVVQRLQGEGAEVQLTGKVRAPGRGKPSGVGCSPSPHPTPVSFSF